MTQYKLFTSTTRDSTNVIEVTPSDASYWDSIFSRSRRWKGTDAERALQSRAEDALAKMLGKSTIANWVAGLGADRLAEVSLVEEGEHSTRMPWEAFLSLATQRFRKHRPLTVVRHFRPMSANVDVHAERGGILFIESAPGEWGRLYSFASERMLVQASTRKGKATNSKFEELVDPSSDAVKEKIEECMPRVVHVGGVHSDEVRNDRLRMPPNRGVSIPTGRGLLMTASGANQMEICDQEAFAGVFAPRDSPPPQLICCNFRDSSSFAIELIRRGVENVVGLQGQLDDATSEVFFAELYRGLRDFDHDVLDSFVQAWLHTERERGEHVSGSGIVLWTRRKCFEGRGSDRLVKICEHQKHFFPLHASVAEAQQSIGPVYFDVAPLHGLNFAAMNARRSPFHRLRFFTPEIETYSQCEVALEVSLRDGEAAQEPFRVRRRVSGAVTDLTDAVSIPLTSKLLSSRLRKEPVQTVLSVDIELPDGHRYQRSHPIVLAPIGEWEFLGENADLLSAHVLPMDPSVAEVVAAAQPILSALADDPARGFDGYAVSRVAAEESKSADGGESADGGRKSTDRQVMSLWHAISARHPLSYISRAPGATLSSQRLRTPTEVLSKGHGTCIDLSLLLASCMEYIGLNPVLVLYDRHACTGYWRSESDYNAFLTFSSNGEVQEAQSEPWVLEGTLLNDLREFVEGGQLVLLETQDLPNQKAMRGQTEVAKSMYCRALDNRSNSDQSEFELMMVVDVSRSRASGISPLPVSDYT